METFKTVDEIKAFAEDNGSKFFSKEAMRFFNSRLSRETYGGNGEVFITSERFDETTPRRYTVRMIHTPTASIEAVSKFQEFATLDEAKKFVKEFYQ